MAEDVGETALAAGATAPFLLEIEEGGSTSRATGLLGCLAMSYVARSRSERRSTW